MIVIIPAFVARAKLFSNYNTEYTAERFFTVFVQPPKKIFLDVAQTFSAGLMGSTDTREAFGTLKNPKMSSQELPE